MKELSQVIERRNSNGTVTLTITKVRQGSNDRFKLHVLEQNFTTRSSMYSEKEYTFSLNREELMEFRNGIDKSLLFLTEG